MAPRKGPARRWTKAEDATLRAYWQEADWRTIRLHLPGRTSYAIYLRAVRDLRLPTGQPQGTVALKPLARSQRYSVPYMRRILSWAEVRVWQFNYKTFTKKRRLCVDQVAALEAFERWEKEAETVEEASVRLHVNEGRLMELMIKAKKRPKRRPGGYAPHWKNLPAEYDRVVALDYALRHPGESMREAARRLNVSHLRLLRALAASGRTAPSGARPRRLALGPGEAEAALAHYDRLKRGQKGTAPAVRPATPTTVQTIPPAGPVGPSPVAPAVGSPPADGASKERKRGRPKGSKTRPKPPPLPISSLPISAAGALPTLDQIARLYGRKPE